MNAPKKRLAVALVFKPGLTPQEVVNVFAGHDGYGRTIKDIIDPEWVPQYPESVVRFNPNAPGVVLPLT